MGDTRNRVIMKLSEDTFPRLVQKYFDYTMVGDERVINCGAEILDRYQPTSTWQGCKRIAGDSYLTAGELFVHHARRSGAVPKNIAEDMVGFDGYKYSDNVFVGFRFVKWFLRKHGITVKGKPEIQRCISPYDRSRIELCDRYPWIYSASFRVAHFAGANAIARLFNLGDYVQASSAFQVFENEVRKGLPELQEREYFGPGPSQDLKKGMDELMESSLFGY